MDMSKGSGLLMFGNRQSDIAAEGGVEWIGGVAFWDVKRPSFFNCNSVFREPISLERVRMWLVSFSLDKMEESSFDLVSLRDVLMEEISEIRWEYLQRDSCLECKRVV